MRKMLCVLMAVMMAGLFACAAMADEIPQAEGGKKFEGDWALRGGLVQIVYEEEGYRVQVFLSGSEWEYSCYYHEDTDSLVSVSSSRTDYTVDPVMMEKVYGEPVYEGLDEEGQNAEFTLDAEGFLHWNDRRDNAGADLQFMSIGRFSGVWKNEEEEVEAQFMWDGLEDEEKFEYTVYIQRGLTGAEHYTLFLMTGTYDPGTGKLSCSGTCTQFTKNAAGEYDTEEDGETYDAYFSMTADGKVLFETANGIELEYDMMGSAG
ncbi:MAG: hypothetical protein K5922_04565 [Clostridiales bacterium]|nr:hypothetical protein [Clostridiales bacterium]